MKLRVVLAIAPGVLVLAACGGSSSSDVTPFASTDEACAAYSTAMAGFPSEAPQLTSTGLNEWAAQVRSVAEETAEIAERIEDALLSQLMREASDGMFKAAEATEAAANNPSEEAIDAINEPLQEGSAAIRNATTSCYGDS